MKAKNTNTNRILSTIGVLILAVTIGYGQGLLAEGAMRLLNINQALVEENITDFVFVNHTEEKDSFSFRNLFAESFQDRFERETVEKEIETALVAKTIFATSVEITYESDVETEKWMETPLSNHLEAGNEVENWMTESFTETVEGDVAVENWMTEPFTGSVECDLSVENWMSESFTESIEGNVATENWMTESFTGSIESEIEIEDWMTASLLSN